MRSILHCTLLLLASVAVAQTAPVTIVELSTRAAAGDARAQLALGQAYERGDGVKQNDKEALKSYRAAAEQGDAEAQTRLGAMYSAGRGVNRDFVEAANWYGKAAKQGHALAMFNLAALYYNGNGVAVDDTAAYAWFVLAEKAGCKEASEGVQRLTSELSALKLRDAKLLLAKMLLEGNDVLPNVPGAIDLYYEVAANAPEVWIPLAKIYISHPAVPHDFMKAEQYCSNAANAGVPAGMTCLAYLNAADLLGPDRQSEAFRWYDKAAHLGDPVACYGLAVMHYEGWGTNRDFEEAFKWVFLAKQARLVPAIKLFDIVSAQLDAGTQEKLTKKAWEEQTRIYQAVRTKVPVSQTSQLSREDRSFTKAIAPSKSSTPN